MGVSVNVGPCYAHALNVLMKCLTGRRNAPGRFYLNQARAKYFPRIKVKTATDGVSFKLAFSYDAFLINNGSNAHFIKKSSVSR